MMSKKNKDIEVRIEEVKKDIKGKNYEVTQLFIGKKMIGEILAYGPKNMKFSLVKKILEKKKVLKMR